MAPITLEYLKDLSSQKGISVSPGFDSECLDVFITDRWAKRCGGPLKAAMLSKHWPVYQQMLQQEGIDMVSPVTASRLVDMADKMNVRHSVRRRCNAFEDEREPSVRP